MKRFDVAAAVCVAAVTVLLSAPGAVEAGSSSATEAEQWGWEITGLRTRLVPLKKQFVVGQPMKFRLELKNFGQRVVRYDPQAVAVNGSLAIRDSQGRPVRYIGGSVQTAIGELPSLAPGNTTFFIDGLDINSQYLIVKPGRYSVQFRGVNNEAEAKAQEQSRRRMSDETSKFFGNKFKGFERHEALIPTSNTAVIDVQPGTLPPVRRVATRLLDVLPSEWGISIHSYPGEINCPPAWETTPPHSATGRQLSAIGLERSLTGYKGDIVGAHLWVSDYKLRWTGKVDFPGQRAATYLGKCPEGYIYADIPTYVEAEAAKWPNVREDIEKALHIVPERTFTPSDGVKDDGDLDIKALRQRDGLYVAGSKITDLGLKRLKGLPELKEAWLSGTQITDTGLQNLKVLTQLRKLALNDTNITDAGMEHLGALPQLQWLILDDTPITDTGMEHLKGLTQLQVLRLNNTKITAKGLGSLKGLTQLQVLALGGTKVTDAGLENLKGLTQLQSLILDRTQITDAGVECLKELPQLKQLFFEKTHVTDQGIKKLQQALPKCEFIY